MYGLVNQAIQELVIEKFGQEVWEKVNLTSGVNIDRFLSNESYDDSVTYKLAQAVSEVAGITIGEVLMAFGEYWVL
jgi:hypothetical protein